MFIYCLINKKITFKHKIITFWVYSIWRKKSKNKWILSLTSDLTWKLFVQYTSVHILWNYRLFLYSRKHQFKTKKKNQPWFGQVSICGTTPKVDYFLFKIFSSAVLQKLDTSVSSSFFFLLILHRKSNKRSLEMRKDIHAIRKKKLQIWNNLNEILSIITNERE